MVHEGGRAEAPRGLELEKARSGIRGLDELTAGGLPRARPTLVCGGPGCGKTWEGVRGVKHAGRGASSLAGE